MSSEVSSPPETVLRARAARPGQPGACGALPASCLGKAPALRPTHLLCFIGQVMRSGVGRYCGRLAGIKAPEGKGPSSKLHRDQEEAAVAGPRLPLRPAALQCLGSPGLGMCCFGSKRVFLSPSPDGKGQQSA